MRIRRFSAAVGALALAVTLTACGSSSNKTDATGAAGGGDVAASLTQANFTKTVTAAQQSIKSAHMDATITGAGQKVSMSGDFSGYADMSSMSMDMSMKLAGKSIEVRLVNKVLYVHGVGAMVRGGKPWVKIDLSDPNNPLSSIFNSATPQSFTAYLQAVKNLKDDGTEAVDGVSTHHYTVTIDTAKAMAANPAFKGHDLSKLGLPATLTTDVWLNSDNLPVKMSVMIGTVGSFEAHFSKYGEKVSVAVPPASQVSGLKLPS